MPSALPQIVLPDRLDQLLAPPRQVESDFHALLQALYDRRYTGTVTLHFHEGQPRQCEFPAPKIKLTA